MTVAHSGLDFMERNNYLFKLLLKILILFAVKENFAYCCSCGCLPQQSFGLLLERLYLMAKTLYQMFLYLICFMINQI